MGPETKTDGAAFEKEIADLFAVDEPEEDADSDDTDEDEKEDANDQ